MNMNQLKFIENLFPASQKLEHILAEVFDFIEPWQKHQDCFRTQVIFLPAFVPNLVNNHACSLIKFRIRTGMLVTPMNRTPLFDVLTLDEIVQGINVKICAIEV
jgi:hypothetical protein